MGGRLFFSAVGRFFFPLFGGSFRFGRSFALFGGRFRFGRRFALFGGSCAVIAVFGSFAFGCALLRRSFFAVFGSFAFGCALLGRSAFAAVGVVSAAVGVVSAAVEVVSAAVRVIAAVRAAVRAAVGNGLLFPLYKFGDQPRRFARKRRAEHGDEPDVIPFRLADGERERHGVGTAVRPDIVDGVGKRHGHGVFARFALLVARNGHQRRVEPDGHVDQHAAVRRERTFRGSRLCDRLRRDRPGQRKRPAARFKDVIHVVVQRERNGVRPRLRRLQRERRPAEDDLCLRADLHQREIQPADAVCLHRAAVRCVISRERRRGDRDGRNGELHGNGLPARIVLRRRDGGDHPIGARIRGHAAERGAHAVVFVRVIGEHRFARRGADLYVERAAVDHAFAHRNGDGVFGKGGDLPGERVFLAVAAFPRIVRVGEGDRDAVFARFGRIQFQPVLRLRDAQRAYVNGHERTVVPREQVRKLPAAVHRGIRAQRRAGNFTRQDGERHRLRGRCAVIIDGSRNRRAHVVSARLRGNGRRVIRRILTRRIHVVDGAELRLRARRHDRVVVGICFLHLGRRHAVLRAFDNERRVIGRAARPFPAVIVRVGERERDRVAARVDPIGPLFRGIKVVFGNVRRESPARVFLRCDLRNAYIGAGDDHGRRVRADERIVGGVPARERCRDRIGACKRRAFGAVHVRSAIRGARVRQHDAQVVPCHAARKLSGGGRDLSAVRAAARVDRDGHFAMFDGEHALHERHVVVRVGRAAADGVRARADRFARDDKHRNAEVVPRIHGAARHLVEAAAALQCGRKIFPAVRRRLRQQRRRHSRLAHIQERLRTRERVIFGDLVALRERGGKGIALLAVIFESVFARARKGHREIDGLPVHRFVVRRNFAALVAAVVGERGVLPDDRRFALRYGQLDLGGFGRVVVVAARKGDRQRMDARVDGGFDLCRHAHVVQPDGQPDRRRGVRIAVIDGFRARIAHGRKIVVRLLYGERHIIGEQRAVVLRFRHGRLHIVGARRRQRGRRFRRRILFAVEGVIAVFGFAVHRRRRGQRRRFAVRPAVRGQLRLPFVFRLCDLPDEGDRLLSARRPRIVGRIFERDHDGVATRVHGAEGHGRGARYFERQPLHGVDAHRRAAEPCKGKVLRRAVVHPLLRRKGRRGDGLFCNDKQVFTLGCAVVIPFVIVGIAQGHGHGVAALVRVHLHVPADVHERVVKRPFLKAEGLAVARVDIALLQRRRRRNPRFFHLEGSRRPERAVVLRRLDVRDDIVGARIRRNELRQPAETARARFPRARGGVVEHDRAVRRLRDGHVQRFVVVPVRPARDAKLRHPSVFDVGDAPRHDKVALALRFAAVVRCPLVIVAREGDGDAVRAHVGRGHRDRIARNNDLVRRRVGAVRNFHVRRFEHEGVRFEVAVIGQRAIFPAHRNGELFDGERILFGEFVVIVRARRRDDRPVVARRRFGGEGLHRVGTVFIRIVRDAHARALLDEVFRIVRKGCHGRRAVRIQVGVPVDPGIALLVALVLPGEFLRPDEVCLPDGVSVRCRRRVERIVARLVAVLRKRCGEGVAAHIAERSFRRRREGDLPAVCAHALKVRERARSCRLVPARIGEGLFQPDGLHDFGQDGERCRAVPFGDLVVVVVIDLHGDGVFALIERAFFGRAARPCVGICEGEHVAVHDARSGIVADRARRRRRLPVFAFVFFAVRGIDRHGHGARRHAHLAVVPARAARVARKFLAVHGVDRIVFQRVRRALLEGVDVSAVGADAARVRRVRPNENGDAVRPDKLQQRVGRAVPRIVPGKPRRLFAVDERRVVRLDRDGAALHGVRFAARARGIGQNVVFRRFRIGQARRKGVLPCVAEFLHRDHEVERIVQPLCPLRRRRKLVKAVGAVVDKAVLRPNGAFDDVRLDHDGRGKLRNIELVVDIAGQGEARIERRSLGHVDEPFVVIDDERRAVQPVYLPIQVFDGRLVGIPAVCIGIARIEEHADRKRRLRNGDRDRRLRSVHAVIGVFGFDTHPIGPRVDGIFAFAEVLPSAVRVLPLVGIAERHVRRIRCGSDRFGGSVVDEIALQYIIDKDVSNADEVHAVIVPARLADEGNHIVRRDAFIRIPADDIIGAGRQLVVHGHGRFSFRVGIHRKVLDEVRRRMRAVESAARLFVQPERQRARLAVVHRNVFDDERDRALCDGEHALLADIRHGVVGKPVFLFKREGIAARIAALCIAVRDRERVARDDARLCCRFAELQPLGGHGILFICGCGFAVHRSARDGNGKRRLPDRPGEHDGIRLVRVRGALPLVVVCVGDADRHRIAVRDLGVHRAALCRARAAARCGDLRFKLRRPVIDIVLLRVAVGGGERRFAPFAPGGAGDGRLFDDHGERLPAHIYRMVARGNAVIHGIGARLLHVERACVACFPVRVVCNAEQPGRFLPVYCGRLRFKRLRKAVARIIHEPFRGRDGHARDRRRRHGIEKVARIGFDGIVALALHVREGDRIAADFRLRADFRLLIGYGGKAEHARGRVAAVQRSRAHRCLELRLRFAVDARRPIDRNGDRARRNGKRARGNVHVVIFAARILHVDGVRVAPRYHMRAVVGKRRRGGQGKPPVRAFKELIRRVPVAVPRIRPGKRGRFVAVGSALVFREHPHAALLHRVILCRIRERVVGVPRILLGIERRGKVVAAFAPFLERAAARKGHRKTDFSVHAHIVRGDARDLVRSVIGERGIRPHRRDGELRDVDRKAARRRFVVGLRHPVMHGVAARVQQLLVAEGCGIPCTVRIIGEAERPLGRAVHHGRLLVFGRPFKERIPVKGIVLIRDAAHRHFGGRDDERIRFARKGHVIVFVLRRGGNAVRADVFRARAAVDRQRHAEVVLAVYRAIRHGVVRTQHGIDGRMRLPVVRLRRHADGDGDGSLLHGIVFGDVGRERVVAERVVALRKRRGKGILPRVQERAFARRDRYSEGYKAAVRGSVLRRDRLLCAVVGIVIPRPGQRDRHRVDDDRKAARLRFVVGLRHPVMYGVASLVHQLALEGIGIPFAGEAEHPCGRAPVRRVRLLIGDRPCKVRLPVKGIFLVGDIDPRHLGGRDGKERRIRGGRVVLRLVDGNDHGVVARVYRLLRRGELLALAHEVIAVRHLDGVAVDLFLHLGGDAAELQRRLGRRSGIRPAFGSRGEPVLREGDLIPHGERFALFAAHGVAHRFAVARARVEGLFVPGVIIGVPQRYGERVGVVRTAWGELADGVERIVPRDGRLQHARLFVVFDIPAVPLPVGQRGRGNEPFSDRPFEGDGAPCGGIPLARPFIVVVERDDDGIGARIRLRAVLRHRVRRARRGREGDRLLFARVGVRAVDRGFVRFRARDDKRRALFPAVLCVGIVVRARDHSDHIVVARIKRFLALRELRIFAAVPAHEPIGVLHLVAVRRLCLRVGRTAVDDAAHRNGKGVGRLPDDPGQHKVVRGIPRTVAPFVIDRVFAQRKRDRIGCSACRRERTVLVVRDRLAVCALRRNGHERRVKVVVERAGLFVAVVGIRRRVRPGGFGDLRPRDGECRRIRRAVLYLLVVARGVGGNGGDHIVQPRVDGRVHLLVAAAVPPAVIVGEGGALCPEPRLRRGQRKLPAEGEA